MSCQYSSHIIAVWMYRFVCLLWLKLFVRVEAYWFQQSTVADLLRRTRPHESEFGWYFSKHFLYKIIYRRIINMPVFSFTVNFPRLLCCCWTGTRAMYQMAKEKKEEGTSDHPVTLFSRELWKWKWPSAGLRGHRGFCLLHPDTHQQLVVEQKDPKAHLHLLLMVHSPQWVSLVSHVAGRKC